MGLPSLVYPQVRNWQSWRWIVPSQSGDPAHILHLFPLQWPQPSLLQPMKQPSHQVHWWLDKWVPRLVQGHWQIPQWVQDLTPSWCTSRDTCPKEMSYCLMSKGQGAPWQDGMPRHDHLCRWTNGLGILYHLCPEGKWQAMSVPGSPWPQWGNPPWPPQDAHCGGSCSWVCTLLLLH